MALLESTKPAADTELVESINPAPGTALLESINPWRMLENLVKIIIDRVLSAVLRAMRVDEQDISDGDSLVLHAAIESSNPEPPYLSVSSSVNRCSVGISFHDTAPSSRKSILQEKMSRLLCRTDTVSVSVSPWTVSLSRVGHRNDHWSCTSPSSDDAELDAMGILQMVRKRLNAGIMCQDRMLRLAKRHKYTGVQFLEILRVLDVLRRMATALDLEEAKRRRRRKRRQVDKVAAQMERLEIPDEKVDEEQEIAKKMRSMKVS